MKFYEVSPVATVATDKPTLTYHSEEALEIGQLVRISIGRKTSNGVVVEDVKKPQYQTKSIDETLPLEPVPKHLIELANWLSEFYISPLPIVWQTILPSGLHKKRRELKGSKTTVDKQITDLSKEQAAALERIEKTKSKTVVLHGVTGSGKTNIYIKRAQQIMADGKSCIVLVPEIGLTSQLIAEFEKQIDNVFVTHSRMTEAQRHQAWQAISEHEGPALVIGPRSALFSPLKNLGLVVIDEFHEPTYKQDQNPKYSATRVAGALSRLTGSQTILGSATPPVSEHYLAEVRDAPIIRLLKPFKDVKSASVEVINLKHDKPTHHGWLSNKALSELKANLKAGKQSLIFHNRRGTASMSLCSNCGWMAECPNCFLPLTLHADWHQLKCHVCNFQSKPPNSCPDCGHADVTFKGLGTKQIESDMNSLFPGAKIARFDTDNKKEDTLDARYKELRDGDVDIIVGTQTIAKGLDLPKLNLVMVPLADVSLYIPDYTSSERTYQLLHQVAGRVGRHSNDSKVLIQTYNHDHPAIVEATTGSYKSFYDLEVKQRQAAKYPPFVHLLKITAEYASAAAAKAALNKLAGEIAGHYSAIQILGPAPSFHERFNNRYRWQLVIKARSRQTLVEIAQEVPGRYQVDLDPSTLL